MIGAGDDIYLVGPANIKAYVVCKSGWSTVYWSMFNSRAGEYYDANCRPRFYPQEASVVAYPDNDNPLVYICQYPAISEEIIEAKGYKKTNHGNPDINKIFGIREHCASWEVISADKRTVPVLMAGEGRFAEMGSVVNELVYQYAMVIDSLKSNNAEADSVLMDGWSNYGKMANRIIADRNTNSPSLSYDPGYYLWDADHYTYNAYAPQTSKMVNNELFSMRYNTFDAIGNPYLNKVPEDMLFGRYKVDGYKEGTKHFTVLDLGNSGLVWDVDGACYNLSHVEFTIDTKSIDEIDVRYYYLKDSPVWCLDIN